jgi:hypothetical protein
MSKSTALTEHGEVSYEVTTCKSCGNEVAASETTHVYIGDEVGRNNWHHKDYTELKIKNLEEGEVCPVCHEVDDYSLDATTSKQYIFPVALLLATKNAHDKYTDAMIQNLNGELGNNKDDDIVAGLVMLLLYLLVMALILSLPAAVVIDTLVPIIIALL